MNRIAQLYQPRHPHIYKLTDETEKSTFVPGFIDIVNALAKGETRTKEQMAPVVVQILDGVYTINMFQPLFCQQLLEEMEHFEQEAKRLGLIVRRPNSMNNYGVITDDLGLREMTTWLGRHYVLPLLPLLFPHQEADLLSHHAFMIRYKKGEDDHLDTHTDQSTITLNVCLGKQFTDGTLYFHSMLQTHETKEPLDNNERKCDPNHKTPHQPNCPECRLTYAHKPGVAVLHLGQMVHGANPLTGGERANWIIWWKD